MAKTDQGDEDKVDYRSKQGAKADGDALLHDFPGVIQHLGADEKIERAHIPGANPAS